MKGRIAELVGESESKNLWMGTFHSIFARILRAEAGSHQKQGWETFTDAVIQSISVIGKFNAVPKQAHCIVLF